jgi:hypothetical protein
MGTCRAVLFVIRQLLIRLLAGNAGHLLWRWPVDLDAELLPRRGVGAQVG